MGYSVYLEYDDGDIAIVPTHTEGDNTAYAVNEYGTEETGIDRAMIDITSNYRRYYEAYLDEKNGIGWLDNRRASECIERLENAVSVLGDSPDDDHWDDTPGNAGYALSILMSWARLHPDARFTVHGI